MMIPVQIKEEKYYSRFQLLNKFSCNYDKLDSILDKLNRNKITHIYTSSIIYIIYKNVK